MLSAALALAASLAAAASVQPPPSPPPSALQPPADATPASPDKPAATPPEAPPPSPGKAPPAGDKAPLARGAVLEEVSGTVRDIDRQTYRIEVDTASGPVTISLDRNTMVYTASGLATVLDVRPGTQIRAGRNADFLAYWVQVRTPSRTETPSTPAQGTGPAGGGGASTPAGEAGGAGGTPPPSTGTTGGPGTGPGAPAR